MDEDLEETIKSQVEAWSSNSNDCFQVDIVRGDGSIDSSFQPQFTYEIFGEEEAIFGYQDLHINLAFAAHNLTPHLSISYSSKFPDKGEVRPTDIREALKDFLPAVAFEEDKEEVLGDENASKFIPPGEKVHEYSREGSRYEIWCASLSDPAARRLLDNMQVLMPMFIEGGSMLQLEQDWTTQRWRIFLLYRFDPTPSKVPTISQYSLAGYGTSYRIFTFPDRTEPLQSDLDIFSPSAQPLDSFLPPLSSTIPNALAPTAHPQGIASPLDLPSRERLSQFLVLPDYQNQGHGRDLYNAMYSTLTTPANIREFTVEDPNEAFDDLRDLCDLVHLRANDPDFAALHINTDIPPEKLVSEENVPTDLIVPLTARKSIQRRSKLMQRQFDRLVEMHTLSRIPPLHRNRARVTRREKTTNADDKAYYFWRLYVKQRLYVFNRDQLAQLERAERIEKLEGALESVQEAYGVMIEKVEKAERERGRVNGGGSPMVVEGADEEVVAAREKGKGKKRKVVVEDDDEEDEMDGSEGVAAVNGSKKMRIG